MEREKWIKKQGQEDQGGQTGEQGQEAEEKGMVLEGGQENKEVGSSIVWE